MASQADIQTYLDFAAILAQAAGEISCSYFRKSIKVDNKAPQAAKDIFNPVTQADREAEAAMRKLIADQFPTHAIMGEEYGTTRNHKQGRQDTENEPLEWVLDPIDGTAAFITGSPLWGTLIALNTGGSPILGLFDQPFTGERVTGAVGQETIWTRRAVHSEAGKSGNTETIEKQILRTQPCRTLAEAKLATTSPAFFAGRAGEAEMAKVSKAAHLIRYGGDCYNYMMLAAGHIDAVIERDLHIWDVQALIPIIQGAGGIITDWRGGDAAQGGQIIAAGDAALHDQLLACFATAC